MMVLLITKREGIIAIDMNFCRDEPTPYIKAVDEFRPRTMFLSEVDMSPITREKTFILQTSVMEEPLVYVEETK